MKGRDRVIIPTCLALICLTNAYYKFYRHVKPYSIDYAYQSFEEPLLLILLYFSNASYFHLINIGLIFAFRMTQMLPCTHILLFANLFIVIYQLIKSKTCLFSLAVLSCMIHDERHRTLVVLYFIQLVLILKLRPIKNVTFFMILILLNGMFYWTGHDSNLDLLQFSPSMIYFEGIEYQTLFIGINQILWHHLIPCYVLAKLRDDSKLILVSLVAWHLSITIMMEALEHNGYWTTWFGIE